MVAKTLDDKPRDSFILDTKIWCHPKGGIPEEEPRDNSMVVIERSLREVGTDCIDLVQLHCQTAEDWTTTYRRPRSTHLMGAGPIKCYSSVTTTSMNFDGSPVTVPGLRKVRYSQPGFTPGRPTWIAAAAAPVTSLTSSVNSARSLLARMA